MPQGEVDAELEFPIQVQVPAQQSEEVVPNEYMPALLEGES